jgi:hypothetical protein
VNCPPALPDGVGGGGGAGLEVLGDGAAEVEDGAAEEVVGVGAGAGGAEDGGAGAVVGPGPSAEAITQCSESAQAQIVPAATAWKSACPKLQMAKCEPSELHTRAPSVLQVLPDRVAKLLAGSTL